MKHVAARGELFLGERGKPLGKVVKACIAID
jgi:hypothetical protein